MKPLNLFKNRINTSVLLCTLFALFTSVQVNAQWTEEQKILTQVPGYPFVLGESDNAGRSVAVDGMYAIVGVPDSDVKDNASGLALVYRWNGTVWVEEQALIPSDGAAFDNFGFSVSISGTTAIVGVRHDDCSPTGFDCGSAYIFEKRGGIWIETAKLKPSDGAADDEFGVSVSIFGTTAIVGANQDDDNGSNSGSAYIFEKPGTGWATMTETAKLTASDAAADDKFGWSVSISGNTAMVGARLDDDNGSSSGSAYIFEKSGGSWTTMTETAKLTPSDGAAGDEFGISVSISGNTAIVGAWRDACSPSDLDCGSAYIFDNSGGSWTTMTETAKLTPSDGAAGDFFGFSVSISGNTAIVGAWQDDDNGSNSGSAYIFEKPGTGWINIFETAKLKSSDAATNDNFGVSVSISGNTAMVGAWGDDDNGPSSGSAYIFDKPGSGWANMFQTAKLIASEGASNDFFGNSVSISGNTAIVGAWGDGDNGSSSGSAYIFEKSGGIWTESAKLTASDGAADDNFGVSVSISGTSAIVGAWGDGDNGFRSGSAYIFEKAPGGWTTMTETAKLTPSDAAVFDEFGFSVSISGISVIAGSFNGSAYIFEKPGTGWANMTETAKLTASDAAAFDNFGFSVSISGNTAIVGAYEDDDNGNSSGSAYIFEKPGTVWANMFETAKLTASDAAANDFFGRSVSISGNTAIVGASGDDDNGSGSGSAYIFEKPGTGWANMFQTAKLNASDGAAEDDFGDSVSIFGTTAIVGANQDDDNGFWSGSAYIFEKPGSGWATMTESDKLSASDAAANDRFGGSVSISGTTAMVGASGNADNGYNSGSAYLFSPYTIIISSAAGTDAQSTCINTSITDITYATTGATGATFTGLPLGVTGTWLANVVTISGTPTESGTFDYSVTTTGGSGTDTATGSITVNPVPSCSTFPWDGN